MNFYIADTHFFHDNILRFSHRPFKDVVEMNETIIRNWNSVVSDNDDVYILGDVANRTNVEKINDVISRLKGKKHLVVGNHDVVILKNKKLQNFFVEIKDMIQVKDGDDSIVLCHYPMAEWPGFYRGAYHFFGHIHNNDNDACKIMKNIKNAYNVGVDILGFCPKTKNQIINRKENS